MSLHGTASGGPVAAGTAPSLSVVIPYHRSQATIAAAVRSVQSQTLAPLEIVICDDGSPDDLDAGLGELRAQVRVIRKPNGGTGSALNAAAQAARGDYLVQLDADDAFRERRLEAVAAVLAAWPGVDVVTGDAVVEHAGREVATMAAMNPPPRGDGRTLMLERNWIPWPAVRRATVLELGGWDERFSVFEDWDCRLRLLLSGAAVAYVHEPLYRWRLQPGSRSAASRVAHYADQVLLTEKALASGALSAPELELARTLLTSRRGALRRARAREAVAAGGRGARRAAAGLLLGAGEDPATRLKAALALASPALAARALGRREQRGDDAARELARRGFTVPAEPGGASAGAAHARAAVRRSAWPRPRASARRER